MYSHTQVGTVIRLLMIISLMGILVAVWTVHQAGGFEGQSEEEKVVEYFSIIFAALIFLVALILLHNLTVYEDHDSIRLKYRIGLIKKRIAFDQIESCSTVKNSWANGWGIRKIRGGWMWNIGGLDAVELRLKGSRVFRIGTDEPDALASVIRARIGVL